MVRSSTRFHVDYRREKKPIMADECHRYALGRSVGAQCLHGVTAKQAQNWNNADEWDAGNQVRKERNDVTCRLFYHPMTISDPTNFL